MRFILFISFLFFSTYLTAQEYIKEDGTIANNKTEKKSSFWENVRFGGNFMILPSSYYGYKELYIDLSPMIAYRFNKRIIGGNYFVYQYYSNSYFNLKTSLYGIKPYLQLVAIDDIDEIFSNSTNLNLGVSFILQQPIVSVEKRLFSEYNGRQWLTATLGGIMIVQKAGKAGFYISLLWGLAGDQEYYYLLTQSNPMIDIGFYF